MLLCFLYSDQWDKELELPDSYRPSSSYEQEAGLSTDDTVLDVDQYESDRPETVTPVLPLESLQPSPPEPTPAPLPQVVVEDTALTEVAPLPPLLPNGSIDLQLKYQGSAKMRWLGAYSRITAQLNPVS